MGRFWEGTRFHGSRFPWVPTGGGSRFRWVPTGSGVSKVRAPVGTMQLAMLLFEEFFLHLWKQEFSEKTSLLFLDTTYAYYFCFISIIVFFVLLLTFSTSWVRHNTWVGFHGRKSCGAQEPVGSLLKWRMRNPWKGWPFFVALASTKMEGDWGVGSFGKWKSLRPLKVDRILTYNSYYGWWFRNPARKPPDMIEPW